MTEAANRFFIQQGSSNELRVSDESAWYVVRQTWPDAHSARSTCQIELKCADRDEAVTLAEKLNRQDDEESLGLLADEFNVKYDTLYQAARCGRFAARKSDKTWLTSRQAVKNYLARTTLKPRKRKGD